MPKHKRFDWETANEANFMFTTFNLVVHQDPLTSRLVHKIVILTSINKVRINRMNVNSIYILTTSQIYLKTNVVTYSYFLHSRYIK